MRGQAAVLLSVVLSGCTSYGISTVSAPPVVAGGAPPEGLGQICVLRPHITGALVPTVFRDNDRLVGATRGPSYFCYFARPGEHLITAEGGDDVDRQLGTSTHDTATVVVAPAGHYYLHQTVGQTLGVGSLQWVDAGKAGEMIEDCEYTVLDAVPGDQALPPRAGIAAAKDAAAAR